MEFGDISRGFVDVMCVFLLPPLHVIVYQPPASYYRLFFKWLQIDVLFIMLNIVQCNAAKEIGKESDMMNSVPVVHADNV